jgi:hypothetical protein
LPFHNTMQQQRSSPAAIQLTAPEPLKDAVSRTSRRLRSLLLALGASVALAAHGGDVSPFFVIDTPEEWSLALATHTIAPVTNFSDLPDFGADSSAFTVPTLSVDEYGLVVDFGASGALGGFEYVFPEDPDLNGARLSMTFTNPGARTYVGIRLTDRKNKDGARPHKDFEFQTDSTGRSMEIKLQNIDAAADSSLPAVDGTGRGYVSTDPGFLLANVEKIEYGYWTSGGTKFIRVGEANTPEPSTPALLVFWALIGSCYLALRRAANRCKPTATPN